MRSRRHISGNNGRPRALSAPCASGEARVPPFSDLIYYTLSNLKSIPPPPPLSSPQANKASCMLLAQRLKRLEAPLQGIIRMQQHTSAPLEVSRPPPPKSPMLTNPRLTKPV